MKRFLVAQPAGNTSVFTAAAAAQSGVVPTLQSGAMPECVLISIERGKEAFISFFTDLFSPPADADLWFISGKNGAVILQTGAQALLRYKEKASTPGAKIYVTPLGNH